MTKKSSDKQELIELEHKIKQAESQNKPIEQYILREIEILQNTIDTFLREMEKQGRLNDIAVAEAEITQYSAMRQLAQKINLPAEQYTERIKQVQYRIFGEENWETFFGQDKKT